MPTAGARLEGRVVLITGVGRGLGRALFLRMLDEGAYVAGCARSESDLASLADGDVQDRFALVRADVTSASAMEDFARTAVERWGRIDGLIANASVLDPRGPLRDVTPDDWRRVIDVNLTGAFHACRAVLPHMRARGDGSIVLVSSGVGDRPRENWGAYAVSKRALEGFAGNLALEERDAGVRVNVVDPGAMRTDMRRAAYPDEDPLTLPKPGDTTDVYVWLVSDAARNVSGERLAAQRWRAP